MMSSRRRGGAAGISHGEVPGGTGRGMPRRNGEGVALLGPPIPPRPPAFHRVVDRSETLGLRIDRAPKAQPSIQRRRSILTTRWAREAASAERGPACQCPCTGDSRSLRSSATNPALDSGGVTKLVAVGRNYHDSSAEGQPP